MAVTCSSDSGVRPASIASRSAAPPERMSIGSFTVSYSYGGCRQANCLRPELGDTANHRDGESIRAQRRGVCRVQKQTAARLLRELLKSRLEAVGTRAQSVELELGKLVQERLGSM